MLEGKQLILATREYAEEILETSRRELGWSLFLSFLAYSMILSGMLTLQILGSVAAGFLLVRLFVIYHDFAHNNIFKGKRTARIFFTLFGLLILAPMSIWKRSHDYHHKHNSKLYTSSIGSFPIITKDRYLSASTKERFYYLFARHPLTILFGYLFVFIYGMCIQSFMNNPRRHKDSLLALVLHIGLGVLYYFVGGWRLLLLMQTIPHLIASAIGSYLFYAQHNFPSATFAEKNGWTYVNAALQSSSYMEMPRWMQWITANIGYHHIHHLNARIPFYRLPEVFHAFEELQSPKRTSLNPKEIYACFQLKVWDPQKNRMINALELSQTQSR